MARQWIEGTWLDKSITAVIITGTPPAVPVVTSGFSIDEFKGLPSGTSTAEQRMRFVCGDVAV